MTTSTSAQSDHEAAARVARQRAHYASISDEYTTARSSFAHLVFIERWMAALFTPWLRACDAETRRRQILLDPICGNAHLAPYYFAETEHVWLNDLSPEMLERIPAEIQQRARILPPSDAVSLPLDDATVDVVSVSGGLHHLHPHLEAGVREAYRVLKPGGWLLFGEPSDDFFLFRWLRALIYRFSSRFDHESERALRSREMHVMLGGVGFEMIETRPFGSVGYVLMAQVGHVPLLRKSRSRKLLGLLSGFDALIESTPLLRRTCLVMMGSARKPAGADEARRPGAVGAV